MHPSTTLTIWHARAFVFGAYGRKSRPPVGGRSFDAVITTVVPLPIVWLRDIVYPQLSREIEHDPVL